MFWVILGTFLFCIGATELFHYYSFWYERLIGFVLLAVGFISLLYGTGAEWSDVGEFFIDFFKPIEGVN